MVSPLSAATQGFISDGSHIPLMVSVQGLLIFAFVPVSGAPGFGGGQGEGDEEELGDRFRKRRQQQTEEDEILVIINAFLNTQ